MEESIGTISDLLKKTDDNTLAQVTEICKSLSADEKHCALLKQVVPDLLRHTSSPNKDVAKNSIETLINITSNVPSAIDQLIGLKAVTRLVDAIISAEPTVVHERLMLLTNLTTQKSGCLQLLDLQDKDLKGQRLLRLAVRFTTPQDSTSIPHASPLRGLNLIASSPSDEYEYAAMVLMNATLMPEGRQIFFETPDFFMPTLMDSISGDNPIRKQGIIGVIRNLCFDQKQHEYLLKKANILPYLVRPLISKTIEDNITAAEMLHKAFPTIIFGDPEPLPENRFHILETLMLLTQSEIGKSTLINSHIIFVLRELDDYETEEENKNLGLRIAACLLGPKPDEEKDEHPNPEDVC
ncbi:protein HGH1 [Histomonas meleagridis]|uniref:protein HGH1-like n=1 Tax=Histomonas meleagridis TaxID=135588 RepID=UPI00355A983E|nr:protein HGH1 [Histomonas meleagridis]KAH0799754.1 protein HGH1-like [Histomonas meleagridis]